MPNETFAQFTDRVAASVHGQGSTKARGSVIFASFSITSTGRPSFAFRANGQPVGRAVVSQMMEA